MVELFTTGVSRLVRVKEGRSQGFTGPIDYDLKQTLLKVVNNSPCVCPKLC